MMEFILMIVALATLCFMAVCVLILYMLYRQKVQDSQAQIEKSAEELEAERKLRERLERDQKAFEDMMSYDGMTFGKGGDDW